MKKLITIILSFLAIGTTLQGQTPIYSMFTFNKLQYNAGYTGSKEALVIGLHYRYQWVGVGGAPRTMSIHAHSPMEKNRGGIGFSYLRDEIGIFNTSLSNLYYAYRIPLRNEATLSFGINVQWDYTALNWNKADVVNFQDTALPFDQPNKSTFNAGSGLYYTAPRIYAGLSIANIVRTGSTILASQKQGRINHTRTLYFMGGTVFDLNSNIVIKPAVLVRYIPNIPIGIDFNLNFLLMEAFWVGGFYRLDKSFGALVRFPITPNLNLGLGIDYPSSDFSLATKGTFEVTVEYLLNKKSSKYDKVNNIRFFW